MAECKKDSIKHLAVRGAVWTTLTSILAIPLGYYRNWMFSHIGTPGEVVGTYAFILLFINIVVAFVMFGGVIAVTNFLPKIPQPKDKAGFLLSYGGISAGTIAIFLLVILTWPQILNVLMRKPVTPAALKALAVLTPIILCSQVITSSLAGLMAFRFSAILAQTQLFLISILATLAYFFFPEFLTQHALVVLTVAVALTSLLITSFGGYYTLRKTGLPKRLYLPPNFWRFTTLVHIQTLCSFAYMYLDQIFVATAIGVRELGSYFIMHQCAQLIRFVSLHISRIMLASFSNLVANGQYERLKSAYKKLCRILIMFSTVFALGLIFFSHQVGSLFGPWFATRHTYLILLTCGFNLANLGSINAMLVLSQEKTGDFLINSFVQIGIQLLLTLTLIAPLEVHGIIIAKIAGLIMAQIGLFIILRWRLSTIQLSPPKEYWLSQAFVLPAACFAWYMNGIPTLHAFAISFAAVGIFLWLIGFSTREITDLLRRRK